MLPPESEHVLICLRYGIGDVVMELPCLDALRDALPDARITALATPPAHELLEGDPRVDAVALTSRWGALHRWEEGTPALRQAIMQWLRAEDFDLVLDALHAPTAVGRAIWAAGMRVFENDQAVQAAALAEGAGGTAAIVRGARAGWGLADTPRGPPRLHLRARDRGEADRLLRELAVEEAPLAVAPVGSSPLKRWPPERFAAVADGVVERDGAPVLVLEGTLPESGRAVVRAMRHASAARRLGARHLLVTAALLRRCRALVSNDTGLMHMAAAVGTPTVAVFGPTRAELFLPPGRHVVGVGPGRIGCGYRATETLHPPLCSVEGRCLVGLRSCIDRAGAEEVLGALAQVRRAAPPASAVPAASSSR